MQRKQHREYLRDRRDGAAVVSRIAAVLLAALMLTACGTADKTENSSSKESRTVPRTEEISDIVKENCTKRYLDAVPVIEERMKEIVNIYAEQRFEDLPIYCTVQLPSENDDTLYYEAQPSDIAADHAERLKEFGIDHLDGWDVTCISKQPEDSTVVQLQLFGGQYEGDDQINAEYLFTTDGELNGAMLNVTFQYDEKSDGNISKGNIIGSIKRITSE